MIRHIRAGAASCGAVSTQVLARRRGRDSPQFVTQSLSKSMTKRIAQAQIIILIHSSKTGNERSLQRGITCYEGEGLASLSARTAVSTEDGTGLQEHRAVIGYCQPGSGPATDAGVSHPPPLTSSRRGRCGRVRPVFPGGWRRRTSPPVSPKHAPATPATTAEGRRVLVSLPDSCSQRGLRGWREYERAEGRGDSGQPETVVAPGGRGQPR